MNTNTRLKQIISGGQTGVDRAALDVAIHLEIQHGGWCPRNRLAEDGPIPGQYQLQETAESDYSVRTEKNVLAADATLVLHYHDLSGGSRLTWQLAKRFSRPVLAVDLSGPVDHDSVVQWILANKITVLNVAGPRESSVRGIGRLAEAFLLGVFAQPTRAQQLGLSSNSEAPAQP